jgi:hypothetical protein
VVIGHAALLTRTALGISHEKVHTFVGPAPPPPEVGRPWDAVSWNLRSADGREVFLGLDDLGELLEDLAG